MMGLDDLSYLSKLFALTKIEPLDGWFEEFPSLIVWNTGKWPSEVR